MLLCKFIYCTYICIDAFPLDVCAHANTDIYIHIETVKKWFTVYQMYMIFNKTLESTAYFYKESNNN